MIEPEIIPPAKTSRVTESAVESAKVEFSIPDSVLSPSTLPATITPAGLPATGSHTSRAVRSALLDQIAEYAPHLVEAMLPAAPCPEHERVTLSKRTTDELVELIMRGRFQAEIAVIWRVDKGDLSKWIAADDQRSARARLARKAQAEMWDAVAFQIGLHAPSDKVEMTRAKLLMEHCRWRSAMFNPDDYGERLKVTQTDDRGARELTTAELQIIARGGVLPGGL